MNTNKQLQDIEELQGTVIDTKSSPSGKAKVLLVTRMTVELEVVANPRVAYDERYDEYVYTISISELHYERHGDGSKPARVWDRFTNKMKHWRN